MANSLESQRICQICARRFRVHAILPRQRLDILAKLLRYEGRPVGLASIRVVCFYERVYEFALGQKRWASFYGLLYLAEHFSLNPFDVELFFHAPARGAIRRTPGAGPAFPPSPGAFQLSANACPKMMSMMSSPFSEVFC